LLVQKSASRINHLIFEIVLDPEARSGVYRRRVHENLTIGRLADAAGVSVETVRYYERRGLLPEPQRTDAGYRLYRDDDVARLQFLLRAKRLGFTLAEIAELAERSTAESTDDVAAAVRSKLDAVEAEIDGLLETRCRLRRLVDLCDHGDGTACLQLRLAAT